MTTMTCPVGHPSGPGQSICPLCGRAMVPTTVVTAPSVPIETVPQQQAPASVEPLASEAAVPAPMNSAPLPPRAVTANVPNGGVTCGRCRSVLPHGAAFCATCGTPVASTPATLVDAVTTPLAGPAPAQSVATLAPAGHPAVIGPKSARQVDGRSRRWLSVAAAGLVVAVGGAVVVVHPWSGSASASTGKPASSGTGAVQDHGASPVQYGAAVEESQRGFAFSTAVTMTLTPSTTSYPGVVAPPGSHFLRGQVKITNGQSDRPATYLTGHIPFRMPLTPTETAACHEQFVQASQGGGNTAPTFELCDHYSFDGEVYDPQSSDPSVTRSVDLDPGATRELYVELGPVRDDDVTTSQLTWLCGDSCTQPVGVSS